MKHREVIGGRPTGTGGGFPRMQSFCKMERENMTTINEILSAVTALEENARKVRQILNERGGWEALPAAEAAKIMMEMHHDFTDGAKFAALAEAEADAAYERHFLGGSETREKKD